MLTWTLKAVDSPFLATVLSDQSKRSMYDAGFYDPLEDEDEVCSASFLDLQRPILLSTRPGRTMSCLSRVGCFDVGSASAGPDKTTSYISVPGLVHRKWLPWQ